MLILNGAKPPTIPYPYLPIQGTIGCTPIHKPFTYPRNIGLLLGIFPIGGPRWYRGTSLPIPWPMPNEPRLPVNKNSKSAQSLPRSRWFFDKWLESHRRKRCFQMRFLVGGFLLPPYKWSQKVIYIYIYYYIICVYIYYFFLFYKYIYIYMCVWWFQPIWKICASQIGWFPQIFPGWFF